MTKMYFLYVNSFVRGGEGECTPEAVLKQRLIWFCVIVVPE